MAVNPQSARRKVALEKKVLQLSKAVPATEGTEGALLCSQQPANGHYPKLGDSLRSSLILSSFLNQSSNYSFLFRNFDENVYEFLTYPDKCYMSRKGTRQNIFSESYTNILVVKKGVSTLRSALLWLLVPLDTQVYFFLS